MKSDERIAILGLGYVGLPVALAFARRFPHTIGFDISKARVQELIAGHDSTHEITEEELKRSTIRFTTNVDDLKHQTFFIVAVPTPIDRDRRPDLSPLIAASRTVAQAIKKGAVVVFESTVYPGVTEEVCGPIIEEVSGLKQGKDFTLGYSPERINPGDREHTFEKIVKVVSGQDEATLQRVANAYASVVDAGVHRAPSIRVAEAAKVIENTQRDLNIALMNELSLIFDRMDIRTEDVLDAAATKWNFLRFTPGLVGGHCIGVDPYYLTAKAESLGYRPEVILSGRRINDSMGAFIAQKTIKMLRKRGRGQTGDRVAVLGLTFKENVPDLRNSRVPDIVQELREYGIDPMVHDPLASSEQAKHEYDIELCPLSELHDLSAVIVAVPHQAYAQNASALLAYLRPDGIVIDVKSILRHEPIAKTDRYWAL
ncbi:MAG: nucleotide sugar dehydrogenase [Polyangiales bacterium]